MMRPEGMPSISTSKKHRTRGPIFTSPEITNVNLYHLTNNYLNKKKKEEKTGIWNIQMALHIHGYRDIQDSMRRVTR